MTHRFAQTSAEIAEAAEALKRLRPVYADLLDFHAAVAMAQQQAKSRFHPEPLPIEQRVLKAKIEGKLPLAEPRQLPVPMDLAAGLFDTIGQLATKANAEMAAAVEAIAACLDSGKIDRAALLTAVLESDQGGLDLTARAGGIDPNALVFMAYGSLKPFVETCAEQLAAYLDPDRPYHTAYCPICGGPPIMATLEEEGRRHLVCGFCWQRWPMRRVFCPFCENTDTKLLDYFFSEAEPDYRVDLCRRCRKYIATLDLRRMARPVHFALEQVATLHLDVKAAEEGFAPGAGAWAAQAG